MKARGLIVAIIAFCLASSGCAISPATQPNGLTPPSTLSAWYKAYGSGDVATSRALSTGSEIAMRLHEALVTTFASGRKLDAAINAKFPELHKEFPNAHIMNFDGPAADALNVDHWTINGEEAIYTQPGGDGSDKIVLKRVGSDWKVLVDLKSFPPDTSDQDVNLDIEITLRNSEIIRHFADEVMAGKFKTPKEMATAYLAKLDEIARNNDPTGPVDSADQGGK